MSSSCRVLPLEFPASEAAWNSYVMPRARSITDTLGWRHVLHENDGIRSRFLAAVDGNDWIGAPRIAGSGRSARRSKIFGR